MDNHLNPESDNAKAAESKAAVRKDVLGLWSSLKIFLIELLDFRHDTDREATVAAIKADIPFKGATVWILICSIFVASIGLNADSTAVVIGAMLISPLMGPILGIGLSIAINDIDTLRKSLINLATMLVLSLITAFLFFYSFPLNQDNSELLGRVKPDIRDVLIAFFGGLALIIARTKKGTIASVIFGVAIATALMPPLCTAGYGLSQGNWDYFFGAMHLFAINTIFIAFATFLVLKILRFPMLTYANSKRRKNIARFATIIALVAMLPAGFSFISVLNETRIESSYKTYLDTEIENNNSLWLRTEKIDLANKSITLNFNGEINEATKSDLVNELIGYEYLRDFSLVINGNKNRSSDKILELYDLAIDKIEERENTILTLKMEIDSLKLDASSNKNSMDLNEFSTLSKDAKIQFSDLRFFGYSKMLTSSDFRSIDTLTLVRTKWSPTLGDSLVNLSVDRLRAWLKTELGIESLDVISE
jgi:uncharacterized hydrophobic protein (TIGR00271 family)|tara:strand:- start:20918 stop:22351 length:1434 start_codon:yes stop_codon:yes gene_type:complete